MKAQFPRHRLSRFIAAMILLQMLFLSGCKPLQINTIGDRFVPSNDRNWSPELAVVPSATFEGDLIHVRNIRNMNYLTGEDFVLKHFDRTIRKQNIQSIDFIVTPFQKAPLLAHTMLSFGMADGSYIGVSVEVRSEVGEKYSPILGVGNQFEIAYVVADERDLIGVRTRHRNDEVYVYPSIATPEQAQELFVDIMQRVNGLKTDPEFYHSITNNCTSNLLDHVNNLSPNRVPFSWRVLLPGFSAEYAYELGLLDNRVPFEDLKTIAYVSDLAEQHYGAQDFSQKIRSRRSKIARLAERQQIRQATLDAGGQKFLDDQSSPRLVR